MRDAAALANLIATSPRVHACLSVARDTTPRGDASVGVCKFVSEECLRCLVLLLAGCYQESAGQLANSDRQNQRLKHADKIPKIEHQIAYWHGIPHPTSQDLFCDTGDRVLVLQEVWAEM